MPRASAGRTALPIALFLIGAAPLMALAAAARLQAPIDFLAFAQSGVFAIVAAFVSLAIGGAAAVIVGTREFPGRRAASVLLAIPIAAPPAFWWIGFSRLPGLGTGFPAGLVAGAVVTGLGLSPISFLMGTAALREIPTNAYEASRLCLSPMRRFLRILAPLARSSAIAALCLTAILALAESEIPFLFGFRTAMTEIVTAFSRTFDLTSVALPAVLLAAFVLLAASLAAGPTLKTLLAQPRGGVGIVRRRAGWPVLLLFAVLLAWALPLSGYVLPWLRAAARHAVPRLPFGPQTFVVSILEPVVTAILCLSLGVAAAYPLRRSRGLRWLLVGGLLLFCLPPAIGAMGWIAIGQWSAAGWATPIVAAHAFRLWGLASLGFGAAYARLPGSLELAARLVAVSPLTRALRFVLPVLAPTLAATSLLAAALVFADRDVSSLLLPPGSERLTLDLYLLSANAPAPAVGLGGLVVLAAATLTALAAAGVPWFLLRPRG